jgi:hypothetical protein
MQMQRSPEKVEAVHLLWFHQSAAYSSSALVRAANRDLCCTTRAARQLRSIENHATAATATQNIS